MDETIIPVDGFSDHIDSLGDDEGDIRRALNVWAGHVMFGDMYYGDAIELQRVQQSEIVNNELSTMEEAYKAGVTLAAFDAVKLCSEARLPTPTWVVEAIADLMLEIGKANVVGRRGKHANKFTEYADQIRQIERLSEIIDEIPEGGIPVGDKKSFYMDMALNLKSRGKGCNWQTIKNAYEKFRPSLGDRYWGIRLYAPSNDALKLLEQIMNKK